MSAFKALLERACSGARLSKDEAGEALRLIVDGKAEDVRVAAFLGAVQARRPSRDELVGFALAMRGLATPVRTPASPLVDTCGTGGDGLGTFNFSTAAALVAAGAGAAVVKHGNRAVSGRCGSADVLEALGAPVDLGPGDAARCLRDTGFAFLFAPRYHPAMARVAGLRRSLGVRTVFNLLGPLANPALPTRQVVGLYDEALLRTYAEALAELGCEAGMVVRGQDGMDELSPAADTVAWRVGPGGVCREVVTPESAGIERRPAASLLGGSASDNARALEALLSGEPGPLADGAALNAAAALLVAGRAGDLREGAALARESVASGRARGVLEKLRAFKPGAREA